MGRKKDDGGIVVRMPRAFNEPAFNEEAKIRLRYPERDKMKPLVLINIKVFKILP